MSFQSSDVFLTDERLGLLQLLKGKTEMDEVGMASVLSKVGERPRVAWYPNAGLDFRDLVELNTKHGPDYGQGDFPGLFVHTDYKPVWEADRDKNNPFKCGLIDHGRNDGVESFIHSIHRLEFKKKVHVAYHVHPDFTDFPDDAPDEPLVFLLLVSVYYQGRAVEDVPVIYFIFESLNFLDQVLLNRRIEVSHVVKVREGSAWGGSKKSISVAYAFLHDLGTRFLFIDQREHTDFALVRELANNHRMSLACYGLNLSATLGKWSGYDVRLYRVTPSEADGEVGPAEVEGVVLRTDMRFLPGILGRIKDGV